MAAVLIDLCSCGIMCARVCVFVKGGREKKEVCECLYMHAVGECFFRVCEGHFSWSHALGF